MKRYRRLDVNERLILFNLINNENFKKRNNKPNVRKIAKQLNRSYAAIWDELHKFGAIDKYNPIKSQKLYVENKKLCRKYSVLNSQEIKYFSNEFNKYGRSPRNIITSYEIKYRTKFSVCPATMYKYIRLGYFNLSPKNFYFKNKKRKSKNNPDDCRGKLVNFRDYRQFIYDCKQFNNNFIWQMDTISCGSFHLLILTNQMSKLTIYDLLLDKKANTVFTSLKKIIRRVGVKKFTCILTDRGKEFYDWYKLENIFKNLKIYFCDVAKPRQKALVERINRDIRRFLTKNEKLTNVDSRVKKVFQIINSTIRPVLGNLS